MSLKFGTSGLRGLVSDLTDPVVARYAAAFARTLNHSGKVLIGRDLRESSPRLAGAVAAGLRSAGAVPVDCGAVPTPALALEVARTGLPAIMVTGSHIPADRNGLKFYTPHGEIGKEDEAAILNAFATQCDAWQDGDMLIEDGVLSRYRRRYADAYPDRPLTGLRVGVYQHSSVARDVLCDIFRDLGAAVTPLARSDSFIPVDTEAVSPEAVAQMATWAQTHDVIVSTDGDADRPMVADETGRIVPGDVLGPLTAMALGAEVIVTPVSSNSLVEAMGAFSRVIRTRIGSPYVIAGMEAAGNAKVAGYEANGGFLLGFEVENGLGALQTRDCVLPMVAPLVAAARAGRTLGQLVDALPPRFTASDRLQGVDPTDTNGLIASLAPDTPAYTQIFGGHGPEVQRDTTDGLRLTFAGDLVLHLRPSGNAPELRCYAEATSPDAARRAMQQTLARVKDALPRR